ncbi:unnamed protein product [Heterobilharzia americana]|nr:unnamed protein product [Heterobilharzia americana]
MQKSLVNKYEVVNSEFPSIFDINDQAALYFQGCAANLDWCAGLGSFLLAGHIKKGMRRRRRSDSEDEDDLRAKRDKTEQDTIESLIYRIGFKDLSNIERDIGELATVILTDVPKNGEKLLKSCAIA